MMMSAPDKRISVAVMEAGHGSRAADIAMSMLESVLETKGLIKKEKSVVALRVIVRLDTIVTCLWK
jgi:hypothetical protein